MPGRADADSKIQLRSMCHGGWHVLGTQQAFEQSILRTLPLRLQAFQNKFIVQKAHLMLESPPP